MALLTWHQEALANHQGTHCNRTFHQGVQQYLKGVPGYRHTGASCRPSTCPWSTRSQLPLAIVTAELRMPQKPLPPGILPCACL